MQSEKVRNKEIVVICDFGSSCACILKALLCTLVKFRAALRPFPNFRVQRTTRFVCLLCSSSTSAVEPKLLLWTSSCSWPGHHPSIAQTLTVSGRMARTDWGCRERTRPATQQQFQFVKRTDADGGRILDSDISVRAARRSMPSRLKRLNDPCVCILSDFHGNNSL